MFPDVTYPACNNRHGFYCRAPTEKEGRLMRLKCSSCNRYFASLFSDFEWFRSRDARAWCSELCSRCFFSLRSEIEWCLKVKKREASLLQMLSFPNRKQALRRLTLQSLTRLRCRILYAERRLAKIHQKFPRCYRELWPPGSSSY